MRQRVHTVLSYVPDDADCIHDELFGRSQAPKTFIDRNEIICRENDIQYGSGAYVLSKSLKRALNFCKQLEVGIVSFNRGSVSDLATPFAGGKQFELGRENGKDGMLECMETRYVSGLVGI